MDNKSVLVVFWNNLILLKGGANQPNIEILFEARDFLSFFIMEDIPAIFETSNQERRDMLIRC
jgi:hypothetical protein